VHGVARQDAVCQLRGLDVLIAYEKQLPESNWQ
jgi:hypothetical protein